jgi:hemolysin type calcium-binding protein
MKQHRRFSAKPLGFTAAATLALSTVGALPAHLALADDGEQPSAAVVNGTLFVNGTRDADAITVGVGADPTTFVVDFGGAAPARTFARASFRTVSVSLDRGDDAFEVNPLGQFSDAALTVRGGRGDDTIGGSRGADMLVGGRGDDTIRGSDGDDLILGGSGNDNVDGERGTDTEELGDGADTALWVPGEGSDVVDGGDGHDALTFVGSAGNEAFALTAAGRRELFTRDLGGIRMDLGGVEQLDLAALAGTDTVIVGDLSGTDLRSANLDLSSAGASDGVLDVVSIAGTDHSDHVTVAGTGPAVDVAGLHARVHISGSDSRDQLNVLTGDGNDTVSVTDAAKQLITVAVDLGADQH